MLSWIVSNLATILICGVLLVVVAAIVLHLVRSKRKGKSSCGCGCADCAMNGACHSKQ